MQKLVECVPNISEGRDRGIIDAVTAVIGEVEGARLLDVDPGACAYVADNPVKDFAGPKGLGWTTVRVRRPQGLHQRVPSGEDVDHEVPDLTTLVGLVRP